MFLRDIWPDSAEVQATIDSSINKEHVRHTSTPASSTGDERWRTLPTPTGDVFEWDAESTYVRKPPYFDGMTMELTPVADIAGARVLATLGDSVTTDHISPAGNIKADSPAGQYLDEHGVDRKDFNSYGSRRGNHEVMIRGTFANIRLKNQLLDGVEGGYTRDFTQEGGPQSFIYDASQNYQAAGHPARHLRRQGVRLRLVARLGGQGHEPAGRQGGHHRELRAHPPLEPHRHGRRAAAVPGGRELGVARPRRHRDRLDRGPRAAERGRHARRRSTSPPRRASSRRRARQTVEFDAVVRIDTPGEADYYRNGGILQYVLRSLV